MTQSHETPEGLGIFFEDDKLFVIPDDRNTVQLSAYNNDKPTVIVYNEMSTSDKDLLYKILGAVKLNEEYFTTLSMDDMPHALLSHLRGTACKKLIVFGGRPTDLQLQVKTAPYKAFHINGVEILFAHSLADVAVNGEYKKALWNALKDMYNIA